MKAIQIFGASLLALSLTLSQTVNADQIEKEAKELAGAPAGFLVKVNPETKTVEVFRASTLDEKIVGQTATATEMNSAIATIESATTKVAEFQLSKNELDKDSSTEAWRYRWYGYGYRWNNWCGYRPYYYNWSNPYYYNPGYFTYANYSYRYSYSYRYNNSYYGWYY